MIYNNTKEIQTESVALFGEEADELLESLDIELGEFTIAIGENVYDGAEAERFLNENGIMLYEDHIVLEGRKAEEYLMRKQKILNDEKESENKKYGKYGSRSTTMAGKYGVMTYNGRGDYTSHNTTDNNPKYNATRGIRNYRRKYNDVMAKTSKKEEDLKRVEDREKKSNTRGYRAAERAVHPNGTTRYWDDTDDIKFQTAADAARRHDRRHSKNESALFDFDIK